MEKGVISKQQIDEFNKLTDSRVFCLMPWVSFHIKMNGNTYPCCFAAGEIPLGSIRTEKIVDLWNSKNMRGLRKNMLQEKQNHVCVKCYEQEASGFHSLRNTVNANYAHHLPVVNQTHPDGRLDELNIVYLDIRFSNKCNFACRTCGPAASTAWKHFLSDESKSDAITTPKSSGKALIKDIRPLVSKLEQIYFAGGEPALMPEHYELLELLLAHGRNDVLLTYATNFSIFKFQRWDLFNIWKRFPNVTLAASLDGSGRHAEYIRKGQSWEKVLNSRQRQLSECPHITFIISSTLSILNSLHLPDFHEEWLELGLIRPEQLHINILQDPIYYRLTTLPKDLKEKVRIRYNQFIDYLSKRQDSVSIIQQYDSAIRFMYSQDTSDRLTDLKNVLDEQDKLRHESFSQTFPELTGLLSCNKQNKCKNGQLNGIQMYISKILKLIF